jgi:hypothetical protein
MAAVSKPSPEMFMEVFSFPCSRNQVGFLDEDMASTYMTMLGELHGGQRDQQWHPNRELSEPFGRSGTLVHINW